MKRLMFAIVVLGLALGLTPDGGVGGAGAADWRDVYKWEVFVWQTDGIDKTKLRVGASDKATDGYDPIYEEFGYLAGYIRAYFYHPEWAMSTQGGSDYYVGDIRSAGFPQTWDFEVLASRTDRDVTVSWNLRHLESETCKDIELSLTDIVNGQTVVMTEAVEDAYGKREYVNTSYAFYNTSATPHLFTIVAREVASFTGEAPVGLRANPGGGRIVLLWDGDTGVEGYRVYRGEDGGEGELVSGEDLLTDVDGDGNVTFVDMTVTRGTVPVTYAYEVRAVNAEGCESEPAIVDVVR